MRILCLGLLLMSVAVAASAQSTMSGTARATDGDGLSVAGIVVRLQGIDALELGQTCDRRGETWACGEKAKRQLQATVEGQRVSCRQVDTDDYGRTVSECTVRGVDIGKAMVASGWALAFRKYSDAYIADELSAKTAAVGIWGSEFENPADYRHRHARVAAVPRSTAPAIRSSSQASSYGCAIKGNWSSKGRTHLSFARHALLRPDAG